MVNSQIENTPVSIQLDDGESTTVPTGEVWKVTLNCQSALGDLASPNDTNFSHSAEHIFIKVNGVDVAGSRAGSAAGDWGSGKPGSATDVQNSTVPFEAVLEAGDKVEADGGAVSISGFVVKD